MRTSILCAPWLLAAVLAAQQEPDWRMPFRNPSEAVDPPADVWRELRTMFDRARDPKAGAHFDAEGIEVCDDPVWREAYQRLLALRQDAGFLSLLIRTSGSPADRELAFYGMFYNPDRGLVMQMLNHIPGEPSGALRQSTYRRAAEFVRAQLPRRNAGDLEAWSKLRVGPAGTLPPKPGEFSHQLDAAPFFVMLTVDSPIDQRQALWFLGEAAKVRPELWQNFLGAAAPALYPLLAHDDRTVRAQAIDFVQQLDPKHRKAPEVDAETAALKAWLDAVLYDAFPPIRQVSSGLTDLYRSEDLDQVIAVGADLLRDGSGGDPTNGTLADGSYYRGLRIARVLPPLDQLGIEVGWVVTSINGEPVTTCAEVLNWFKRFPGAKSILVEFVAGGIRQAKEFRRAD